MTDTTIRQGDCVQVMANMPEASVDAIITDPPYAIGVLGHGWDKMRPKHYETFTRTWAEQAFRVLKPGGYLAAFGAARTYHRQASGIEDAGFQIKTAIAWLYTQGYPMSTDVTDAVDAWQTGDDRTPYYSTTPTNPDVLTITRFLRNARNQAGWTNAQIDAMFGTNGMAGHWTTQASQPHIPRIEQWDRLKGALRFDDSEIRHLVEQLAATRTVTPGSTPKTGHLTTLHDNELTNQGQTWGTGLKPAFEPITLAQKPTIGSTAQNIRTNGCGALHLDKGEGRWPANVTIEHGLAVTGIDRPEDYWPAFRYTPKTPPDERPEVKGTTHPTVKPLALMAWLVDLIAPPNGTVLDPFAGSGTTGIACLKEGRLCVLIEQEPAYVEIIEHRLAAPLQPSLMAG